MLDDATIAELYAPKGKASKGDVFKRTSDGLVKQRVTKMGDHDFGIFHGKVGSIRRNNKGGSYRVPNGSRKYAPVWWQGEDAVVAYKLKRP